MSVISKIKVGGTTYDINSVMGASGSSHSKGLVPDPGATQGTTKFLREDGTWQTPSAAVPSNVVTTDIDLNISGLKTFGINGISFAKDLESVGGAGDIHKDSDGYIEVNGMLIGYSEVICGDNSNIFVTQVSFGEVTGDYILKEGRENVSGVDINYVEIYQGGDYPIRVPCNSDGDDYFPMEANFASGLKTATGTSDDLLTGDGYSSSKTLVLNGIDNRLSGSTYSGSLNYGNHYSFGTMTSISISGLTAPTALSSGDYPNAIYSFSFDSGNTATTLSLPASVIFNDWDYSSLDTSTHYEINIRYNASTQDYYGVMQKWALS